MKDEALTVQELRESLANLGYEAAELVKMGKRELKELYQNVTAAKSVLEEAVATDEGIVPTEVNEEKMVVAEKNTTSNVPAGMSPTDQGWTDFVLKQFASHELENGNPKADGLRRVAELLLGEFDILTNVLQTPTMEGGATVKVSLYFHNGKTVEGAADVSSINTARDFAIHAVATAETRAEGRALRKALRLTRVLAAEELNNADPDEANGSDGRITSSMINSLKMMCQKQNVDLDAMAKGEFQVNSVEDLTPAQGRKVATVLGNFHRGEREIPDEYKAL